MKFHISLENYGWTKDVTSYITEWNVVQFRSLAWHFRKGYLSVRKGG